MKRRLLWATILLCLMGMTITPGHGQASGVADSFVNRAPSGVKGRVTARVPAVVCRGLRYFRFDSQYLPSKAVPRSAVSARTVGVSLDGLNEPLQSARQTGDRAVNGAGRQLNRIQAFARWCQEATRKIGDACETIASTCRRLQQIMACLPGSGQAQAATPLAPAGGQAVTSSPYRYTWINQRGDCILTEDPTLDPNHGGKPVWRCVRGK